MDSLLDVNVLVALFWPRHMMHDVATIWFHRQDRAKATWATCALTEAGFVRVLSNPIVNQGTLTPLRVTGVLEKNLKHPAHKFWAMDLSWPEALRLSGFEIEVHQQVTDIYLVGLAIKHKGRLVTFDKALGKAGKHVTVLGQP